MHKRSHERKHQQWHLCNAGDTEHATCNHW